MAGIVARSGWVVGAGLALALGCGGKSADSDDAFREPRAGGQAGEGTGGRITAGGGADQSSTGGTPNSTGGAGDVDGGGAGASEAAGDGGVGGELTIASCGNGVVEPPEQCDDGNSNKNDDCLNNCQAPTCGDGILHNLGTGNEICDDGEDNGYEFPARCSPTCTIDDHCFNGLWEPEKGEECDSADKGDDTSCNFGCQLNRCGDGYAYLRVLEGTNNPNSTHECDDANEDDSDACTSACEWNVCGDGVVFTRGYDERYDSHEDGNELDDNPNPVEECDDGNDEPGDGCDECQLED